LLFLLIRRSDAGCASGYHSKGQVAFNGAITGHTNGTINLSANQAFTVTLWLRFNPGAFTSVTYTDLFSLGDAAAGGFGASFKVVTGSSAIIKLLFYSGSSTALNAGFNYYSDLSWHHWTFRFDLGQTQYSPTYSVFLDGVYFDGAAAASGPAINGNLYIGAEFFSGVLDPSSDYLNAALTEFRLYSRGLLASEIMYLYSNNKVPGGAQLIYYPFQEQSGVLVINRTPGAAPPNSNLTLTSGAAWQNDNTLCLITTALTCTPPAVNTPWFTFNNSYATSPAPMAVNIPANSGISFCVWLRLHTYSAVVNGNNYFDLFSLGDVYFNNSLGFSFGIASSPGNYVMQPQFWTYDRGLPAAVNINQDTAWHFWCGVHVSLRRRIALLRSRANPFFSVLPMCACCICMWFLVLRIHRR
jgi:hypothetical protein